ncbi:MAG: serine/threonine-protein phosphatase [Bradymonadaceae bacterium]|nr:serine/threonine-protein phosphatase [Lujinxingiaceae bacterium]
MALLSAGQEFVFGERRLTIQRALHDDASSSPSYLVLVGDAKAALLWQGSETWGRRVLETLSNAEEIAGLPRIIDSQIGNGSASILLTAPPASAEPFDVWKWRHVQRTSSVESLRRLALAMGAIHARGGWLQGLRRHDLFMTPSSGALFMVAMPRLAALDRESVEAVWRDIRVFGELAFENFMEREYPGGHQLVALLQDRAAMAEAGLNAPGLTQVLAGCVTPYGDLAYTNIAELLRGLDHFRAELVRPLNMRVGSTSTLGSYIFRQNNQDACGHVMLDAICGSRKLRVGFFCVADGIGGIQDGEHASRMIVESACTAFARAWSFYGAERLEQTPVPFARGIARVACQRLVLEGEFDPGNNRGGTTFSGLLIAGGRAGVCHIGDSRVMLVRGDECIALTEDHSLAAILIQLGELTAEEAERNEASQRTISRFMSTANEVECERIDGFPARLAERLGLRSFGLNTAGIEVRPGDIFVLTSDGAHNEYDLPTLRRLIAQNSGDPQKLCDAIAGHALERIGRDNSTVVAVLVEG